MQLWVRVSVIGRVTAPYTHIYTQSEATIARLRPSSVTGTRRRREKFPIKLALAIAIAITNRPALNGRATMIAETPLQKSARLSSSSRP